MNSEIHAFKFDISSDIQKKVESSDNLSDKLDQIRRWIHGNNAITHQIHANSHLSTYNGY